MDLPFPFILRRETPVPQRVLRVPDINLLPPELASRRFSPQQKRLAAMLAALVLLAAVQGVLLGPRALATAQALLPDMVRTADPLAAEAERLQLQIRQLRAEVSQSALAREEVAGVTIRWGDLLTYVYTKAPEGVTVETVRQEALTATLTGTAETSAGATAFQRTLEESPVIADADLKSITRDESTSRFSFIFEVALAPGEPVEAP
jgi:Tfp pilus assembly protein PilN